MTQMECISYRYRMTQKRMREETVREMAGKAAKFTYDKGFSIPHNLQRGIDQVRAEVNDPESPLFGGDPDVLARKFKEAYKAKFRELKPYTVLQFEERPQRKTYNLQHFYYHPSAASCVFSIPKKPPQKPAHPHAKARKG